MTRLWIIFLAAVAMATANSFFASSPGKARAFSRVPMPDRAFVSGPKVPKTAVGRQRKLSSGASRQEQRGAINRAENNSRYFTCFKTISRGTGRITEFATRSSCANGTFESFKNRFSRHHSASEVSRPFGSFCSKLASYFKRSRRSGGRCGLQTRVHNNSISNWPAPRTTLLKIGQNRYRDPIPDTERGPKTGSTRSRPISEQSFSSSQTRRDFTSSDQPQGFERFSPIHTFQNGGYPSPARSSSTEGLAGQSRPEGCLFCSTDLEGSPEVSSFPLEGHTSGICLSPVWSSSRTEIVHQNYEACRCLASPGGYSVDNLPGRSVVHACNTGGATGGHGHSPLPPRKPRVCDKPREVSVCSNTKTRISGVRYQYHRYDSSIARRQGEVDQISVQDFAGATTSLSTGPFSTDWQTYGINSGCFSCPLALSPPPTPQKSGSCEGKWLRFLFTPFTGSEGGNPVVASPPRSMERQGHPEFTPRSSDRDRCLEGRVGSSLSRSENRSPVVSDGKEAPYKLPGVASRFVCGEKFHQEPIVCPCEASHGQHNCSSLCEPTRGYPFFSPLQFSACSVGMGPKEQHHAQRRTLCGPSQHGSRLGARHFRDASNWRLDQNVFSSLMQIRGPCAIDLFADRLNSQLPQFYSWKPDPLAIATDPLLQDWSRGRNYAFPPFCLIMRSLAKLQGAGGELILITPVWPTQAWYPRLLDMSVAPPVLLPSFPDLLLSPRGERHPLLLNETLSLAAWHVSSSPCNRRAFLQTLPGSSWQHGGQAQAQFITPPGKNGIAGVTAGKLIHFAPLWLI